MTLASFIVNADTERSEHEAMELSTEELVDQGVGSSSQKAGVGRKVDLNVLFDHEVAGMCGLFMQLSKGSSIFFGIFMSVQNVRFFPPSSPTAY